MKICPYLLNNPIFDIFTKIVCNFLINLLKNVCKTRSFSARKKTGWKKNHKNPFIFQEFKIPFYEIIFFSIFQYSLLWIHSKEFYLKIAKISGHFLVRLKPKFFVRSIGFDSIFLLGMIFGFIIISRFSTSRIVN